MVPLGFTSQFGSEGYTQLKITKKDQATIQYFQWFVMVGWAFISQDKKFMRTYICTKLQAEAPK